MFTVQLIIQRIKPAQLANQSKALITPTNQSKRQCSVNQSEDNITVDANTASAVSKDDCTIGWSDLTLFSIFENGHFAADQVYF